MNARLKMPVFVVGCDRRDPLVLPFLYDQTHTLHQGADIFPGEGITLEPQYENALNLVAHYRVFRIHQAICRRFLETKSESKFALILEDDAVPNLPDWPSLVNRAMLHLNGTGVLSLHGRQFRRDNFKETGKVGQFSILRLNESERENPRGKHRMGGYHHVYGATLAYLISQVGARIFSELPWTGRPVDVVLADDLDFLLLDPSPFNHDRRQGSLVDPKFKPA